MDKEGFPVQLKVSLWGLIFESIRFVVESLYFWISLIIVSLIALIVFNELSSLPFVLKLFLLLFCFIIVNPYFFLLFFLFGIFSFVAIFFTNRGKFILNREGLLIESTIENGFVSWDNFIEAEIVYVGNLKYITFSVNDYGAYLKTASKKKSFLISPLFIYLIQNPFNIFKQIKTDIIYLPIYWFKKPKAIVDLLNEYKSKPQYREKNLSKILLDMLQAGVDTYYKKNDIYPEYFYEFVILNKEKTKPYSVSLSLLKPLILKPNKERALKSDCFDVVLQNGQRGTYFLDGNHVVFEEITNLKK